MRRVTIDTGQALREADLAALGGRIRSLRLARRLTQGQLAGGDMSIAYVSRIEAGTRRPDLRILDVIAERLGTTTDQLVTGVDATTTEEIRLALRFAELALASGEPAEAESATARLLAAAETKGVPGAEG